MNALQYLLDSGVLYLAIGALICVAIGIPALRRMWRGGRG